MCLSNNGTGISNRLKIPTSPVNPFAVPFLPFWYTMNDVIYRTVSQVTSVMRKRGTVTELHVTIAKILTFDIRALKPNLGSYYITSAAQWYIPSSPELLRVGTSCISGRMFAAIIPHKCAGHNMRLISIFL